MRGHAQNFLLEAHDQFAVGGDQRLFGLLFN
jgi:hypothetical protein